MKKIMCIVIPVYNLQEYLRAMLDSIISQKFNVDQVEVLLINDGSEDESEKIIDQYCYKYNYIKKINKQNGGVSSARNLGIANCNAEYIAFWDGDDYIAKDAMPILLDRLVANDLDLLLYNYKELVEDKEIKITSIENIDENIINLYLKQNIKNYPWSKVYKTSLLKENNIEFPEGEIYEDIYFTLKILLLAKKIDYINKYIYIYRIRVGSLSRIHNSKTLNDYIKNFKSSYSLLIKFGYDKKYYNEFQKYCVENLINIYKIQYEINEINQLEIKFSVYSLIKNKTINYREKIIYILMSKNIYKYYKKVRKCIR